jgi:hypothetical protein
MLHLRDPNAAPLPARLTDDRNVPMVTWGCSGTRLTIEPKTPVAGLGKGGLLRLFAVGWK